jgi:hypothetical protein
MRNSLKDNNSSFRGVGKPYIRRMELNPVSTSNVRVFTPTSLVVFLAPILALVYAVTARNFTFLDYVHVLTGGMWTGIDLFMGLVMSRILRSLDPGSRAQLIMRLTPLMLLFMPSIAAVATTAGVYLASWLGIFKLSNPIILATGGVVLVLIAQGFGIIMPNEVRIFLEIRRGARDREKINRLGMRNIYVGGSQVIFQIVVIFLMAKLTVG